MQPEISVVMAMSGDYDGPLFTLQHFRHFHKVQDVEFVIVDNDPQHPAGKKLREDIDSGKYNNGNCGVRYIEFPEPRGTAAPREAAIQAAEGRIVICCDSHIHLLHSGALGHLANWFRQRRGFKGVLSGPLIYDNFDYCTHYTPFWRGEMWGIWGQAWEFEGQKFTALDIGGKVQFARIDTGVNLEQSPVAEKLPKHIYWAGHEAVLVSLGCRRLGGHYKDQFEIPGMGLGMFAFLKEHWPGFNPHLRGFGGEELYIHEKFRRQGGQALCLGFLKWWHRFGRPLGTQYPLTLFDKARNNILTHIELGLDLEPVKQHFTTQRPDKDSPIGVAHPLSLSQWEALVDDPINARENRGTTSSQADLDQMGDPEYWYNRTLKGNNNYFNHHLPTLRALAELSEVVVDITRYVESSIALAAGRPKRMVTYPYAGQHQPFYKAVPLQNDWLEVKSLEGYQGHPDIPECDLLMFKTPHAYNQLRTALEHFAPKVRRWIILHDTARNGMKLDGGGPGYVPQMKDFLEKHPNWFITKHFQEDTGLTILSQLPEDRPENEIILWPKGFGPGTMLKKILKEELGINPSPTCDCEAMANLMDMLGVERCRMERNQLVVRIKENYERWGWKEALGNLTKGALKAILPGGIAWKLKDKTDPMGSLFDLAVDMEEERIRNESWTVADDKVLILEDNPERQEWLHRATNGVVYDSAQKVIDYLKRYRVDFLSLDHDLEGKVMVDPSYSNTGSEVVRWIVANKPAIKEIVVHSLNDKAAPVMVADLKAAGYNANWVPYNGRRFK